MKKEAGISSNLSANEVAKVFEQRDLVSAAVINGDGMLLGAAGMPVGVAEIEKAEIRLLFSKYVRVDAQR